MKEFYGNVSLILDLNFSIEANSIEEAKEKIFEDACLDFRLYNGESNEDILIEIYPDEWYLVDEPANGNVRQSGVREFEIYEED